MEYNLDKNSSVFDGINDPVIHGLAYLLDIVKREDDDIGNPCLWSRS